jgi:hypothetical protein
MNITLKQRVIIKSICLVILLVLCVAVYKNGQTLDCNKCVVKFTSEKYNQTLDAKIMELSDNLNGGKCYVEWTETQGFFVTTS